MRIEQDGHAFFNGVFISAAVWNDSNLTWLEKCLIGEIDCLSGEPHGPCTASASYLAKIMDSTPSSIRNMLSDLTKRGYLINYGSHDNPSRAPHPKYSQNQAKYKGWQPLRCNSEVTVGAQLPGCQVVTPGLLESQLPGCTEIIDSIKRDNKPPIVPQGGQNGSAVNGSKPKNPKLTVEFVLEHVEIDLTLQTVNFLKAWKSWISARLQLPKKPAILPHFEEHMRICSKLGETRAIAAIHHSIGISYASIFERPDFSRQKPPSKNTGRWEGSCL